MRGGGMRGFDMQDAVKSTINQFEYICLSKKRSDLKI